WQTNVLVFATNDTVSYASPVITPDTLRQNRTRYDSSKSTSIILDTTNPVPIQFDGQFFDPLTMVVTYGPVTAPNMHVCTLLQAQSSSTTVTCNTEIGSQNAGNFV